MDQAPMASAVRAQPRLRASADTAETAHRADTAGRADGPMGSPPRRVTLSGHRFDDEDYPAYSMGRAAEILGVTQAFLRSLGAAKLIAPQRSEGGHRRYSRYQLRLAARARELVDQGTALEAACRIIILEDQLAEALRINTELQHEPRPPPVRQREPPLGLRGRRPHLAIALTAADSTPTSPRPRSGMVTAPVQGRPASQRQGGPAWRGRHVSRFWSERQVTAPEQDDPGCRQHSRHRHQRHDRPRRGAPPRGSPARG